MPFNNDMYDALEDVRKDMQWPNDDLLIVLHIDRARLPILKQALNYAGLQDVDGVELRPDRPIKDKK